MSETELGEEEFAKASAKKRRLIVRGSCTNLACPRSLTEGQRTLLD